LGVSIASTPTSPLIALIPGLLLIFCSSSTLVSHTSFGDAATPLSVVVLLGLSFELDGSGTPINTSCNLTCPYRFKEAPPNLGETSA
jgi:hypothetical protein